MVTLGSIQPTNFSAFHGAGPYDDALNFRSFELALNDVPDITASCEELVSAEERVPEHSKPTYSSPMAPLVPSGRSGITDETAAAAATATAARLERRLTPPQNSSSSDRLLRPSKPEPQSWHPLPPARDDASSLLSCSLSRADRGLDSRLRASSWHAADMRSRKSPSLSNGSSYHQQGTCFSLRSPKREAEPSKEEDKPSNEILDGSDVLQQISNVTSTEPSNEREVFVGGLRESEDSVHITEEELATYFSKFGIIESVSINRDDRTHRGRGFAFVKFFQESAALNAVVADASTHVIRGTTVSVQWSRGAKDGGDRPRRRNSSNSGSGSGNGGSPPRNGRSSSSSKNGMFPPKGHRGGGGGGSCGGGCSRGFSPLRNRSQSHVHPAGSGAGGMPFAYCGGGHGGDHLNQAMVCVVVPAQRAAALGLSHLPQHAMGSCASRGTPPRDIHFPTLTQSTSAGGGHGQGQVRYPSHTRSHSYSISPTSHGHGHSSGGGGYLHHAPQGADQHEHHAIGSIGSHHHVGAKTSHSYGVPAPMHMPPLYHERRELSEPRGYQMPLNSGNGGTAGTGAAGIGVGSGGGRSMVDYKRSKFDLPPPSTSYPPPGWSGDGTGMRGMSHDTIRSQSPPIGMRTAHGTRNGGGAPRPTPPQPRGYDKQSQNYQSSRYGAVSGPGDGLPPGIPVIGRRHSGSSLLAGSDSMRQDVLAATNFFYSAGDIGNEHTYDHDFSYGSASRLA